MLQGKNSRSIIDKKPTFLAVDNSKDTFVCIAAGQAQSKESPALATVGGVKAVRGERVVTFCSQLFRVTMS